MTMLSAQPSSSVSAGERALWSIAYCCLQPRMAAKSLSKDQGKQLYKIGMVLTTGDSIDGEKLKQFTQLIDNTVEQSEERRKFLNSLPHFSVLKVGKYIGMHWGLLCLRISQLWRCCFGEKFDYQIESSKLIYSIMQPSLSNLFTDIATELSSTSGWDLTFQGVIEQLVEQEKSDADLQAFSNMLQQLGLNSTAFDEAIVEAKLSKTPPPESLPTPDMLDANN